MCRDTGKGVPGRGNAAVGKGAICHTWNPDGYSGAFGGGAETTSA